MLVRRQISFLKKLTAQILVSLTSANTADY